MTMWILSILKALLTPVIGCITVYIAIRQWRDNHLRLKLDRYDRRLHVYQEVVKTLRSINGDLTPEWDDLLNFTTATAEAPFLFKAEIPAYIDEMFSRANKLRVANMVYRRGTEQMPVVTEKFKDYLYIASRG